MPEQTAFAVKQGTELFRKVYNKEISEETFYHKHFDNPTALPVPYIIESQNEQPVAMRWLMKLHFRYNDMRFSGVQSSDDAVSKEARGLLFLKMRKKTLSILKEENIDFEYGCFNPGTAMEIAEKSGEKNVINLQLARLFLNEKKHRWKRFDIVYPGFIKNSLAKKRKSKLSKMARKDLKVSFEKKCPFNDSDYEQINDTKCFCIERNQAYYQWKTDYQKDLLFVTARFNDRLLGFLIIKNTGDYGTVIDWDVFGDNKVSVLAAMLDPVCLNYSYLDIPSLNVESGEMKLFTDLGCKDMSDLWAPICICVKPISDSVVSIAENPLNWKHRLIDADYFLNGE